MQHCLICGAKSWGPATPGFVISGDFQVQLSAADTAKWRRCDACGSLAQSEFIDRETERKPDATFSGGADAFALIRNLLGSMPTPSEPVTRVERIARAIIRAQSRNHSSQSTEEWARWLCHAARCIEHEMDEFANPSPFAMMNDPDSIPGSK